MMTNKISENILTEIVDKLAPLNNKLRMEKNPTEKVKLMWDFGKILDFYLNQYNSKLHELLYLIYDPHSTNKLSNITRDLGSYCYRIFKYFQTKDQISKSLLNLKSYSLFRESIPLLFNEKYKEVEANKIFTLLNSNLPNITIKNSLIKLKKSIITIKNPRNQKAYLYKNEDIFIKSLIINIKNIYNSNDILPNKNKVDLLIGDKNYREILIKIILVLADDSFLDKIASLTEEQIPIFLKGLYKVARGGNINRSRFRRWVLTSTKLLSLAEGLNALNNEGDYISYKKKLFLK